MNDEARKLLDAAEARSREDIPITETSTAVELERGATSAAAFNDPGVFANRISPIRLMVIVYLGMLASFAYGVFGSVITYYFGGKAEAQIFWISYTTSFKTIFSLGLILGTALIVYRTKVEIPNLIEGVLKGHLSPDYYYYRRRFLSLRQSLTFSMEAVVLAFVIFSYCRFPLARQGEVLMLIAVCVEYALGAYIISKLIYAATMLLYLLNISITKRLDLSRTGELNTVNTYIQLISMMSVISVCVHVMGYYRGPFMFTSIFGTGTKVLVLLPPLLATPLLVILHFYPRVVLQRLLLLSVKVERNRFKRSLAIDDLSAFQKRYCLMEFEKLSRNELNSRSRLSISDLLLTLAVIGMLLAIFWR